MCSVGALSLLLDLLSQFSFTFTGTDLVFLAIDLNDLPDRQVSSTVGAVDDLEVVAAAFEEW